MKCSHLTFMSLTLVCLIGSVKAIWQNSGPVRWANNCGFKLNDFNNTFSSSEQCGHRCFETPPCSHFVWTNYQNGTCWLKSTEPPFPENFESTAVFESTSMCGFLQISWVDVENWAYNCKFTGEVLNEQQSNGNECGPRCKFNPKCTHFTWLPLNGGTCLIQTGGALRGRETFSLNGICGIVPRTVSTTTPSDECTCPDPC